MRPRAQLLRSRRPDLCRSLRLGLCPGVCGSRAPLLPPARSLLRAGELLQAADQDVLAEDSPAEVPPLLQADLLPCSPDLLCAGSGLLCRSPEVLRSRRAELLCSGRADLRRPDELLPLRSTRGANLAA